MLYGCGVRRAVVVWNVTDLRVNESGLPLTVTLSIWDAEVRVEQSVKVSVLISNEDVSGTVNSMSLAPSESAAVRVRLRSVTSSK